MAAISTTKYRIEGDFPYEPWNEMRHAARSLCRIAREHPRGSAHTISAAVVMTAFSVEAFCQTLGPGVLEDIWVTGKCPAERWPVLKKLKEIAKRTNSGPVDYGVNPWKGIADLFKARDRLAHAKPDPRKVNRVIDVPDGVDPVDCLRDTLAKEFQPLHDLDRLEALAQQIDEALLPIWKAAGRIDEPFLPRASHCWTISAT